MRYASAHALLYGDETNCDKPGVFLDGGESACQKRGLCQRKGGRGLLLALRPGDHVICTSPHRLFRNLREMENQLYAWEQWGVHLHFTDLSVRTDTPNGRLLLQMMGAVAEYKAAITKARVAEKKAWVEALRGGNKAKTEVRVKEPEVPAVRVSSDDPVADARITLNEERLRGTKEFTGVVRAYVRVSTADQTCQQQQYAIERWLQYQPEFRDAQVVWYEDHGVSSYKRSLFCRPAGKRMMKDVEKGDFVVCLRVDRLARKVGDLVRAGEHIESREAAICFIDCNLRTDTVLGSAQIKMIGAVAELESVENDLSSSSAANISFRTKGLPIHHVPAAFRPPKDAGGNTASTKNPLATLLTPEEWYQVWSRFYTIIRDIPKNRPVKMIKNSGRKGSMDGRPVEGQGIWQSNCRMVNRELCQQIGWPAPEIEMLPGWWIEEAERMQQELGFSQRRADLLEVLHKMDPTIKICAYPIHTWNANHRWRRVHKIVEKIKVLGQGQQLIDQIGQLYGIASQQSIELMMGLSVSENSPDGKS